MVAEDLNQFPEAAAAYRAVLSLDPEHTYALARLGVVLLALNQAEQARTCFENALQSQPDQAYLYQGLAKAAVALNDYQAAVGHFEKVLALEPQAKAVYYPLGLAYRGLGKHAEAREHLLKRAEGRVAYDDPYLARLSEILTRATLRVALHMAAQASSYTPRALMDYITHNLGERPGLIEFFSDALDEKTYGQAPASAQERARLHFIIAILLAHEGDPGEALTHLQTAVDLKPDFTEAFLESGFLFQAAGQYQRAIDGYDRILELTPQHAGALLGRAACLRALHRLEEAEADLHKALAEQPNLLEARLELADLLKTAKESERGIAEYRQLLDRELGMANRIRCLNGLGLLLQYKGENEKALQPYRESLRLDPNQGGVGTNLATALAATGRFGEAAQAYETCLQGDPSNEPAWLGAYAARVFAGKLAEAKEGVVRAHAALPESGRLSHLYARFLVAVPDSELRDPALGLQLLERLLTSQNDTAILESYAMALAGMDRHEEALTLQRRLVEWAKQHQTEADLARLTAHMALYEAGKACCEQFDAAILLP